MVWLKKNWFKLAAVILVITILSLAFYWYEWRPMVIVKRCAKETSVDFRRCLFENGYPLEAVSTNK